MWLQNYKFRLKELDLAYKFKTQEFEEFFLNYKMKKEKEMLDLAERCAADTGNYEHDYHQAIQLKQTELAKLDALIQARTETANNDKVTYERLLKSKEDENIRLTFIIKELTNRVGYLDAIDK